MSVSLEYPNSCRTVLNIKTSAIGYALSINGIWTIACQLLLLNRLRRWLGVATAYKLLTFGWIVVYFLLPKLRDLLELLEIPLPDDGSGRTRYSNTRSWGTAIGVNAVLSFVTVVGMNNSLLMVLVNYSSPDRSALGAVNGITTAVGVSNPYHLWTVLPRQAVEHHSRLTRQCMARVMGPSLASAVSLPSLPSLGRLCPPFSVFLARVMLIVSCSQSRWTARSLVGIYGGSQCAYSPLSIGSLVCQSRLKRQSRAAGNHWKGSERMCSPKGADG